MLRSALEWDQNFSDLLSFLSGCKLFIALDNKKTQFSIYLSSYHYQCSPLICIGPELHPVSFPFCVKDFLQYFVQCGFAGDEFFNLLYI